MVGLVKKLLSEFAGWFECDHHIKPDKEILHFRHELGIKWSIYLAEASVAMFNAVLDTKVTTEISNSSATITIYKQKNVLTPS